MRTAVFASMALVYGQFTNCSGCDPNPSGSLDVDLTVALADAPADYIASAVVDIGEITLTRTDGAAIVITDDGGEYDLITLQDGVTADLATVTVDPGEYHQLRMVVEGATVTLASGYTFRDGTTERELDIPSGASSGIKVNLGYKHGASGVQLTPGETLLVIDFDVSQNFRIQGSADTAAGIQDVSFTPLLRATVADIAGSISGMVTSLDDGTPVGGLTVEADLVSSPAPEPLQTTVATALTDASGAYTVHFLSPGDYVVSVIDDDGVEPEYDADPQDVTLGEAEDLTGVDFAVSAAE